VFEGVPLFTVAKDDIIQGVNVIDLLAEKTEIFSSKGELRRTINGNGLSINKDKVTNPDLLIGEEFLINGKYILAQKGKKNYFMIIAQ
jgi:tyrosyl-tRNA synthetase